MALDENKAPQDEKEVNQNDQQDVHSFISSESAAKLFRKLCRQPYGGQTDYFLNVYWDKYGKDHKDEIFGIFGKFAEINETSGQVTMNQVWYDIKLIKFTYYVQK